MSEQQSVGSERGCHQGEQCPDSGNSQCKGPKVGCSEEEAGEVAQSERGRMGGGRGQKTQGLLGQCKDYGVFLHEVGAIEDSEQRRYMV